jgi:sulfatase modifying factor 1
VTLRQWRAITGKRFFGAIEGPDTSPAQRISWHDCQEYIKKLNQMGEGTYRLPTEAEWEYACRAGTTTAYSWGNTIDCTRAMYENSDKTSECTSYVKSRGLPEGAPAPVGSYPPNPWGLYDMNGNVWEWCLDWYGDYPDGPVTDPQGPESGPGRVRRGGSWFKYGYYCRSANRNYGHAPTRYRTTGFRLVRELE